jgi:hypothetical protein
MANDKAPERYLVTFEKGDPTPSWCADLEDAIAEIRDRLHDGPVLWVRAGFVIGFPDAETPAPKKRASRRKRNNSPAPESEPKGEGSPRGNPAPGNTESQGPAVAATAVSETGTVETTPAAPPVVSVRRAPPALACGGARCRDNGRTEVHDANDANCSKMHPKRALR